MKNKVKKQRESIKKYFKKASYFNKRYAYLLYKVYKVYTA